MSHQNFPKIYSPEIQSKEDIINSFVVRNELFSEILDDIINAKMKYPEPHYLIQGMPGMGKTMLLHRIFYEVYDKKSVAKRQLIPVIFLNEYPQILNLLIFFNEVIKKVNKFNKDNRFLDEILNDNFKDYDSCFNVLEKSLQSQNSKLILFVDNLNILLDKFNEKELLYFSNILKDSSEIRVIGTSSIETNVKENYYRLFDTVRTPIIRGLTAEEVSKLLNSLSESYSKDIFKEIINDKSRIKTLQRITSGNIRTIVLLFESFLLDKAPNTFEALENLLDRHTPLYKSLITNLSSNQQYIIHTIALNWDAIPVKDITKKTNVPSNIISAQLKQLSKTYLIEVQKTKTKNNLYRLADRFFNIWYLMRYSREEAKNRIRFLLDFFQSWNMKGFQQKSDNLTQKETLSQKDTKKAIKESREKAVKFSPLTPKTNNDSKHPDEKHITLGLLNLKENKILAAETNFKKAVKSGQFGAYNYLGLLYDIHFSNFVEAENCYLKAIESGNFDALINLGLLYQHQFHDFNKAKYYFNQALKADNPDALICLSILYYEKEQSVANLEMKLDESIKTKLLTIGNILEKIKNRKLSKLQDKSNFLPLLDLSNYNLPDLSKKSSDSLHKVLNSGFHRIRVYPLYEYLCIRLIQKKDHEVESKDNKLLELLASSVSLTFLEKKNIIKRIGELTKKQIDSLSKILNEEKHKFFEIFLKSNNNVEALTEFYREDVEKYQKAIKDGNLDAYVKLAGLFYSKILNYQKAEELYLKAIEKGYTKATIDLAKFYENRQKDYNKAEQYYLQAVEKNDSNAMIRLALLYENKLKNYAKAEQYYLQALENNNDYALLRLANFYSSRLNNYEKALEYYSKALEKDQKDVLLNISNIYGYKLNKFDKAEKYLKEAVGFKIKSAHNNLAWLYFKNKIKKEKALELATEAFERNNGFYSCHTLTVIYLWNNKFDDALTIFNYYLKKIELFEDHQKDMQLFFLMLISKKQYETVFKIFAESTIQLKERLKPIYYALMFFMKDQYPNEYLKMGSELKETVQEVIEKINELEKDYE